MPVSFARLPFRFEVNRGQTDPRVDFVARGRAYTLFLTPDEGVLTLHEPSAVTGQRSPLKGSIERTREAMQGAQSFSFAGLESGLLPRSPLLSGLGGRIAGAESMPASVLRMRLVNANAQAKVTGLEELPGKGHYFLGNDPKKWRTNVANYAKVRYQDVYPGIDLIYYGNQGKLEHDFVVSPGADPSRIKLAIDGAEALHLDAEGSLVAQFSSGNVVLHKPTLYQPKNPKSVDGRFVLLASNRIGFEVSSYDASQPLIIDPVLEYSTYLGGTGDEACETLAVDASGNVYVAGETSSLDFPTSAGAYQPSGTGFDVFVTKLNPAGSALVYSTYLGGGMGETAVGSIAINSSGEAHIAGYTQSADFPTTVGAFQTVLAGESDVFVTKLNATGSALVYSTYLGGSGYEDYFSPPSAIALDASGNAYIAGTTSSIDFPTTPNAYDRTCGTDGNCNGGGYADTFVTKLNPAGTTLVYSTYLGGSAYENQSYYGRVSIVVDASGNAIVSGNTSSADFPTTSGAFQTTLHGYTDAYVVKLNSSGTALLYSTYFGGSDSEGSSGLSLGAAGNIFVAGTTFSIDFPTTTGAFDRTCGGCTDAADAFVAKMNPTTSALVYSTYLGGSAGDVATGISVDSQGNAYAAGFTGAMDFPLVNPLQSTPTAYLDAFLSKLNSTGGSLLFSTRLGGGDADAPVGIGLDSAENVYIAGLTVSYGSTTPFPTTPGAFQTSPPGNFDGFVAKVSTQVAGPSASLSPPNLTFGGQLLGTTSGTQKVTLTNSGSSPLNITGFTSDPEFAVIVTGTTCPTSGTLAAGASCDIVLSFAPQAASVRDGWLSISTDAPGSPHKVKLSGTGTDFSLAASPGSRTINAGQSTTYTLNINPVAGFNQKVSLACSGAPARSTCEVSPSSATPDGTNAATVTVNVTTTARSMAVPPTPLAPPRNWVRYTVPWLASLTLLLFGVVVLRRRREYLVLAGMLLCVTLWAACGGGGGGGSSTPTPQPGTAAGTYTLTLTGIVGNASRQTTATLTVN